jgi:aspartate carbamoyltransferase catalytic subunit
MKHILKGEQFDKKEVEKILKLSSQIEKEVKSGKVKEKLKGKIIASIFFEPSTRTRLSFETAALRLGARVISAENAEENSSSHKGETIEDTFRMLSAYADLIVSRHKEKGSIERGAEISGVPVINAGDGANEHPSQGILDLYTISKELKRKENLKIVFVGDLLYSRTLHSLVPILNLYKNNKFYFISPKELKVGEDFKKTFKRLGVSFEEGGDLKRVIKEADVVYMTRVQKERFKNEKDYNKVKDSFLFTKEHLKLMKKDAIVMHPLPRINEISKDIDSDPHAAYFRQAQNGLYVRMALLLYVFGF